MMFEMVLEMAMACGAVYEDGDYRIASGAFDMPVDFSAFDADSLGSLSVLLGHDVCSWCGDWGSLVHDVFRALAEDYDSWELGFVGEIDGEEYAFVMDCAD